MVPFSMLLMIYDNMIKSQIPKDVYTVRRHKPHFINSPQRRKGRKEDNALVAAKLIEYFFAIFAPLR
jgi:hypothetical protein